MTSGTRYVTVKQSRIVGACELVRIISVHISNRMG